MHVCEVTKCASAVQLYCRTWRTRCAPAWQTCAGLRPPSAHPTASRWTTMPARSPTARCCLWTRTRTLSSPSMLPSLRPLVSNLPGGATFNYAPTVIRPISKFILPVNLGHLPLRGLLYQLLPAGVGEILSTAASAYGWYLIGDCQVLSCLCFIHSLAVPLLSPAPPPPPHLPSLHLPLRDPVSSAGACLRTQTMSTAQQWHLPLAWQGEARAHTSSTVWGRGSGSSCKGSWAPSISVSPTTLGMSYAPPAPMCLVILDSVPTLLGSNVSLAAWT